MTINNDLYISFSGRAQGNSDSIIDYLKKDFDTIKYFRDLNYHSCSNCNYECFHDTCIYRDDDIYDLYDSFTSYKRIYFVIPMYGGNASSLYYIFNERSQDYFMHNDTYESIKEKLRIILIYGSKEESPAYTDQFTSWVNDASHILSIERHTFHQKMKDSVLDVETVCQMLTKFKEI